MSTARRSGPPRVWVGGVQHETHSFSRVPTHLEDFDVVTGSAMRARYRDSRLELGAVLNSAATLEWTLHLGTFAQGNAGGRVTVQAWDTLRAGILADIEAAGEIDAVLLVLHGSMTAEHCDDCDGDLTAAVRRLVGRDVPIAVTLDLHANVSDQLAGAVDIVSTYRTTPHVDTFETAERACRLLARQMRSELDARVYVARGPMLDALDRGRTLLPDSPMRRTLAHADQLLEATEGVEWINVHAGYALADVPHAGPSIVVVSNGPSATAAALAETLIATVWQSRAERSVTLLSIPQALAVAASAKHGEGPLLIGDYTDNPGGGGHGDATNLLLALIEAQLPRTAFFCIADPEVVEACWTKPIGARIDVTMGGKIAPEFGGGPVPVSVELISRSNGEYVCRGEFMTGMRGSMGRSVCLRAGTVDIIVTSKPTQTEDRAQFRLFGIAPESMYVLACKAQNHFRADFERISSGLIYVDSGGITSLDYTRFPYRRVRRPIWPLDDIQATTG